MILRSGLEIYQEMPRPVRALLLPQVNTTLSDERCAP